MSEQEQELINEFLKNNTVTKCPDVYECVTEHEFSLSVAKNKGRKIIKKEDYAKGAKYLEKRFR